MYALSLKLAKVPSTPPTRHHEPYSTLTTNHITNWDWTQEVLQRSRKGDPSRIMGLAGAKRLRDRWGLTKSSVWSLGGNSSARCSAWRRRN